MTAAVGASVMSGDVEAHHSATDGGPEGYVDLILEIGPGFRTFLGGCAVAAENARENVAEAAAACRLASTSSFDHIGEVEAAEIELGALGTVSCGLGARAGETAGSAPGAGVGFRGGGIDVVGIEPDLVVDLALLRIAQYVVGLRQGLEFLFGCFIAGVDIGMILARKFAECLADVLGRGRLLDPEDFVIVLLGSGGHRSAKT